MVNNLIKWHGGKLKLKYDILKYFKGEVKQYIEPFIGGGSVFLIAYSVFKECNNFILSDSNANLINAYIQTRDNLSEVINIMRKLKHEQYYETRSSFNLSINERTPQQAGTMLWLILSCFGGGWRENRRGEFTFSKGWSCNKGLNNYCKRLQELSTILQDARIKISHQDFHSALNAIGIKPKSFFFFDPPYIKGAYSPGFEMCHHKLLADWCGYLDEMNARWLMSNAGDEINTMYTDFIIDKKWVQRTCGGDVYRNNITKEYWIRNR